MSHNRQASITLDSRVRVREGCLSQELAGDTVLLELQSGTYFGLDAVGTRIWALLHAGQSLRAIATQLSEEYDASPEQLARDVCRLAGELITAGLVEHATATRSSAR